jgi:general secretion pathway protein L
MLLNDFLRSQAIDARDIGIQVPLENFFCRTFVLPFEACRSVDSIVIQDLCRKTPFKLQDVYQTYVANVDKRTNRIIVIQWVMRRAFVQQLINALGLDATPINFVEAERDLNVREAKPKIILQANPKNHRTWIRAVTISLCAGGILLALAVGGLRATKQQTTLDELEVELASIRPKAQQVRVIIHMLQRQQAALSRIRARKRESAGLLEIWDNATRTLPPHTWLIELRLSERPNGDRTVAMTGFSAAAGSLVALLDAQPLFGDVELTAPIATDATEGRERFALQAKLRNQRER